MDKPRMQLFVILYAQPKLRVVGDAVKEKPLKRINPTFSLFFRDFPAMFSCYTIVSIGAVFVGICIAGVITYIHHKATGKPRKSVHEPMIDAVGKLYYYHEKVQNFFESFGFITRFCA